MCSVKTSLPLAISSILTCANLPAQQLSWLAPLAAEGRNDRIIASSYVPPARIGVIARGETGPTASYGILTVGCSSIRGSYLAMHDTAGKPLWIRTTAGRLSAITSDSRGRVFVTGMANKFCGGNSPDYTDTTDGVATLACYSASGDLMWVRQEPKTPDVDPRWPNVSWGSSLSVDSLGNVYMAVTDHFDHYNSLYSFYVVKYDDQGNRKWATPITSYGMITSICAEPGGGCYITGVTHSPIILGAFQLSQTEGFFLARFNQNGNVEWAKTEGTKCWPRDVKYNNGHLYLGVEGIGINTFGTNTLSPKPKGTYDLLLKFDMSGAIKWAEHAGGTTCRALGVLPNGDCFYTGSSFLNEPV